ncbi:class I SAM-dependent methyltransferase [Neobacillus sp. PS3-40]|uniref:class I SAM-dependent methyltransferase n=1 Tax=Neobacillus sp. PS3-40 TaxID=3070679 RepID=UPI0027E09FBF|nr:class I SAM-dependent methyltransferase [Neobacillus sp. PS3-40]WML44775.1 class I SAM-dependent methyltransferase [Neobacillus sp. PS3-40]
MGIYSYFDFLAKFGVGGAHPGGILLTKEVLSKENISNNSFILDAGCGTGQTAAYLFNQFKANVWGIEINPIMVKKAKKRFFEQQLPIQLVQGSIEEIPFENNSFDLILSESVLAFVDKRKALQEFSRVLKKGGRLIANEMTINFPLAVDDENEIKQFYDLDSLLLEQDWRNLLEEAGFKNIQINDGKPALSTSNTLPEFHFSKNVEPELFDILNQHAQIIINYQDSLGFRIITCTK